MNISWLLRPWLVNWITNHSETNPHPKDFTLRGFAKRHFFFYWPWASANTNHIYSSDPFRYYHDHPYNYVTIILKGSYKEHRLVDGKEVVTILKEGDMVYRNHKMPHRLTLLTKEVWTLNITGKRTHEWGVYDLKTHEYTPWSEKSKVAVRFTKSD